MVKSQNNNNKFCQNLWSSFGPFLFLTLWLFRIALFMHFPFFSLIQSSIKNKERTCHTTLSMSYHTTWVCIVFNNWHYCWQKMYWTEQSKKKIRFSCGNLIVPMMRACSQQKWMWSNGGQRGNKIMGKIVNKRGNRNSGYTCWYIQLSWYSNLQGFLSKGWFACCKLYNVYNSIGDYVVMM